MTDPHLLPNQLDLLVDGDAGPDAQPLWMHLQGCDECRTHYANAKRDADALESVPHFTPRLPFADHVMAKVQVNEPWHATLSADARRMVPTSGPVRSVAAAGAILTGLLFSALALWLALRWDLATWMLHLGLERAREAGAAVANAVVSEALGGTATAALARGDLRPVALAAVVLVTASVISALAFRRLAATSRAKRG